MYIKSESVNEIFEKAKERMQKAGISVKEDDLQRFQRTLDSVASRKKYKPGEELEAFNCVMLMADVTFAITNIRDDLAKLNAGKEEVNCVDQLMSVTDYFYAMAMQKLGCPDIPASFGDSFMETIDRSATAINSKMSLEQDSNYAERIYQQQRYKNAGEVWSNVNDAMNAARGKTATPAQIQNLIVEYQALNKRQSNHGPIWRFFHGKENEERVALMNDMKEVLQGVLGTNSNLERGNALQIVEMVCSEKIGSQIEAAFKDNAMSKRIGVPAEAFEGMEISRGKNLDNQDLRISLQQSLNIKDMSEVKPIELVDAEARYKTNEIIK